MTGATSSRVGTVDNVPRLLAGLSLLHLLIWTAVPTLVTTNAPFEVVRAVAYGHEWQMGYRTGPPLVPWLLEGIVELAGTRLWPFFLSAQLCLVFTFVIVWKLARRFCGPWGAFAAVLAVEGVYFASNASPELNPSVVQMPLAALFGWRLHSALVGKRMIDWIIVGFSLGLGLWASYSMAAYVAVLAVVPWFSRWRGLSWAGVGLATAVAAALILPHVAWLADGGLDQIVGRVGEHRHPIGGQAGVGVIALPVLGRFLATLPFWLIAATLLAWHRHGIAIEPSSEVGDADRRVALALAICPVVALVVFIGITGRGFDRMLDGGIWCFMGLAIVIGWRPVISAERVKWFGLSWAFVFLLPVFSFTMTHTVGLLVSKRELKAHFPGALVARTVTDEWRRLSGRPLRYVVGSGWLAGNVGLYSADRPTVFVRADPRRNPWVDLHDLAEEGAVLIWSVEKDGADIPEELSRVFPAAVRQPVIEVHVLSRRYEIGWAMAR